MNKQQFIQRRSLDWQQFEKLVNRVENRAYRKIPARDAAEFSRLFRRLCFDLALVRSHAWGKSLVEYLNQLVGRGHNAFYSSPPETIWQLVRFLTVGFPRVFRKRIGYFLVASAAFFIPLAVTWAIVQADPTLANRIAPPTALEEIETMYAEPLSAGGDDRAAMAGFYVLNNAGIALRAFGQGILFAVPTLVTLLFNGILLGAMSGYVISRSPEHAHNFLTFVFSHGSFELTAIAVAGGAGMMLGHPLIQPGRRRRIEALRYQGLEAVQIACGAAVMLIIAALIEAFWSPAPIPDMVKYAGGIGLWLAVIGYLGLAGRGAE